MTGPLTPTEIILLIVGAIGILIILLILFWPQGGDEFTSDTTTSYNSRGHRPPDY
jgi:hypothetical protein